MTDNAFVKIGAQIGGLQSGMQQAAASVRESTEKMRAGLEGVASASELLKGGLVGLAGFAGASFIQRMVADTMHWSEANIGLARVMGMTVEKASELNTALQMIGMSTESYTAMAMRMQMHINTNSVVLEQMGLKFRDVHGDMLPMQTILGNGVELLNQYKAGADRNSAALYLFGRGAKEVYQLQEMTNEVMEQAKEVNEKFGASLSVEQVDQYRIAQAKNDAVMRSFSMVIAQQVLPVMNQFSDWMTSEGPGAINGIVVAIKSAITVFDFFKGVIQQGVVLIAASFQTLMHVFEAAATVLYDAFHPSRWKQIGSDAKAAIEQIKNDWVTALDEMDRHSSDFLKSQDSLWNSAGQSAGTKGKNTQATPAGHKKFNPEDFKGGKDTTKESEAQAVEEAQLFSVRYWQERVANDEKMGAITASKAKEYEFQIEEARYQVVQQYNAKRIELMQNDPSLSGKDRKNQEAKINAEIEKAAEEHALKIQQINDSKNQEIKKQNDELVKKMEQQWTQMLSPISSAVETSVQGIVMGTQTLKQAEAKIAQSVLQEFISMLTKKAVAYAAHQLALTSAAAAGETARGSIESTAAISSMLTSAKMTLAKIGNYAAEAFAGVTAFLAPMLGPGAPVGAAIVSGLVIAEGAKVVSSAAGGYDIPSGINPMTQLHQREMVLPAELADKVRNVTDGGGDIHLHIHDAADAKSIQRFFKDNGRHIVDALRAQQRNLRGFAT